MGDTENERDEGTIEAPMHREELQMHGSSMADMASPPGVPGEHVSSGPEGNATPRQQTKSTATKSTPSLLPQTACKSGAIGNPKSDEEDSQASQRTVSRTTSPKILDKDDGALKMPEQDRKIPPAENSASSMTAFMDSLFAAGRITLKEFQHSEKLMDKERLDERHRVLEQVRNSEIDLAITIPDLVTITQAPIMVRPSQLTATSNVLNLPELFEQIYLDASGTDLHTAAKVCIGFQEMVLASSKMCQNMSYIVDTMKGIVNVEFEGADFTQHPHVKICAFDEGFYGGARECWKTEYNFSLCDVYGIAKDATLCALQLASPPVTHAEASWIDHCTGWHHCWPVAVSNPEGVTIQDVLNKVEAAGQYLERCEDHEENQRNVFEHLRKTCGRLKRIEISFATETKMSAADYHRNYECNEDCDCDDARVMYPELWAGSDSNGDEDSSAGLDLDEEGEAVEHNGTQENDDDHEQRVSNQYKSKINKSRRNVETIAEDDKNEAYGDQDGDETDSAAEISGDEFDYEDPGWDWSSAVSPH